MRAARGAVLVAALLPGPLLAQAQFTPTVAPNPVTVQTGGPSVGVTVSTAIAGDFREPITYTFTGFPVGISTGGSRTVGPPHDPLTFPFSATTAVAPGTYTGTLSGTASGQTVTVPMTVMVQRPDFGLSAAPGSLTLVPGESGIVNVSVAPSGGFTGTVGVVASGPGSLAVQPGSFTVAAGGSQTVMVNAAGSAQPGTLSVEFTGTAGGVAGTRTAMVGVTIRAHPPVIEAISPPVVVAGTRENVLRLTGRHFHASAVITSATPGVQVIRARVLTPTAAEVVVAVRRDAPPGAYRLDLRNPDGVVADGGATLVVRPGGALAGPLAVTGVQIVAPRPWQLVAEDEPVHAHALVATSGMGTVVGTWLLDGVPFERFTRVVSSGHPIDVRSTAPIPVSYTGEHRLELVFESPRSLPAQGVQFFQAPESRSGLRVLAPGLGGRVDPASPVFRWTLVPGASGYEVEVRYRPRGAGDTSPWTVVRRRVTEPQWRPEDRLLEALTAAEGWFRVRAAFPGEAFGEPTPWLSLTAGDGSPEVDAPERPRPPPPPDSGWGAGPAGGSDPYRYRQPAPIPVDPATRRVDVTVGSTTTATSVDVPGPSALTRLQLSTRIDVSGDRLEQQVVGDFTASHDLDSPWHGRGESRSWVARAGARSGEVRPAAVIGFAPPSFLDRSELLSVFTSGGGVQGTLATAAGRVSYFRSATLGASSGMAAGEPNVGAAAYEVFSQDGRFLFRATTVHVTDRPLDGFSGGGAGTALGVLASAEVGPGLEILGEAAMGDYRPGEDSFDEERDGRAFRLSARGGVGTFGYAIAVGRTDQGFVNPANPGFTPGGISGRSRADVTLSNSFGRAAVSAGYNRVRGGIAHDVGDPRTTENGANLSVSMPVSDRVTMSLSGNMVGQRGAAIEELGVPKTHVTRRGMDLSVTQRLGPVMLSQTASWQDLVDRGQRWADQRVTNLSLGAHGAAHRLVNLSANVTRTAIAAAPEVGGSEYLLVSFQPVVTVGCTGLRLTPRMAYSRSSNDLDDGPSSTLQYQLGALWAAPWEAVPLTFEVSNDWNRHSSVFDEARSVFDRRTMLTVSLNWGADRAW